MSLEQKQIDPNLSLINLARYDILNKERKSYQDLKAHCQKELRETGLCVLPDFIEPQALKQMQTEARQSQALSFHSSVVGNAYLKDKDSKFPVDHAFNLTDVTTLGVVAFDQIKPSEVIRRVYESQTFLQFLGDALGRDVYYYECPLGKINYSMMAEGDYLRWHFDQSDFVVSIPVQDCEKGGVYEYVYNIRSEENENYDQVQKLLNGDRSRVQTLSTPEGSLILFEGRYTIHRVTEISGQKTRIMALLGFADRAGVTSSEYLRKIRYGRIG